MLPLASGQACFGVAFPPVHMKQLTRSSLPRLWEQGVPREGEDDCWGGEIARHYPLYTPKARRNRWRGFWMCEFGTGQHVAQLHVS